MAKSIYDIASTDEMIKFERQLSFWLSHQPLNCPLQNPCDILHKCQSSKKCVSKLPNSTVSTYHSLSEKLLGQPSAQSITKYFSDWKSEDEKKHLKKTLVVVRLLEFLHDFEQNPSESDPYFTKFNAKLKNLYDKFWLQEGCALSIEAIKVYPFQVDIIRWWTLFHNRKMEWIMVREQLKQKINQTDNEENEEIRAECYLGIFESFLNEFTKDRHNKQITPSPFNKLKTAKDQYLDKVPKKEDNGKFHYFLARYYEEEWWVQPENEKSSTQTLLDYAITAINKSIELYELYDLSASGYQTSYKIPWWLYCHKAMLFKLWGHDDSLNIIEEYKSVILKEAEEEKEKKIHSNVRCYEFRSIK